MASVAQAPTAEPRAERPSRRDGLTREQRQLLYDSRLYAVRKTDEGWVALHTDVPAEFSARRGEQVGELVVTSNTNGTYTTGDDGCSCPDWEKHGEHRDCKHMAVRRAVLAFCQDQRTAAREREERAAGAIQDARSQAATDEAAGRRYQAQLDAYNLGVGEHPDVLARREAEAAEKRAAALRNEATIAELQEFYGERPPISEAAWERLLAATRLADLEARLARLEAALHARA